MWEEKVITNEGSIDDNWSCYFVFVSYVEINNIKNLLNLNKTNLTLMLGWIKMKTTCLLYKQYDATYITLING